VINAKEEPFSFLSSTGITIWNAPPAAPHSVKEDVIMTKRKKRFVRMIPVINPIVSNVDLT
jgi:hypothetical protein